MMKNAVLFVMLIFLISCSAVSQSNVPKSTKSSVKDTLKPTSIELIPPFFEIPKPKGKFITETLKIKNSGNNLLVIDKVETSCYCGSSTVLNSRLEPGEEGKILLNVNLDGLYDDNNIVQFTIHSNAINSPSGLNMTIIPAVKDSSEQKEK